MKSFKYMTAALTLWLFASTASAHSSVGFSGGFLTGFLHPILGFDHVAAMVAVGLWGAFLRNPAIWILPVVFPIVMAFGGALGVLGVPIPAVETGIAASALVIGALIALAVTPPLPVAALIVAAFAIFHGHAHGTELPQATNPFAYGVGFVIGTGLLHMAGIAFGMLIKLPSGKTIVRTGGGVIALTGVGFLAGWI